MSHFHRFGLIVFVMMFLISCVGTKSADSMVPTPEKLQLIFDTDANNELDDQHALAYLLFNLDIFDLEGITVNSTFNGGGIQGHFDEAERVVKLCDFYPEMKIYKGAESSYEAILSSVNEVNFDGSEAVDFIIQRAHVPRNEKLVLLAVGKLTNVALAFAKDPSIIEKVRVVWLGSNFPAPGEYNLDADTTAVNPVLQSGAEIEMVTVRYDDGTGTTAVVASLADIRSIMPGKGPRINEAVTGRHGGSFYTFGDYSIELFEKFEGNPVERPLFDMAAVAILKNPSWAQRKTIGTPLLVGNTWREQVNNPKTIDIWEYFDKDAIMADFYGTMTRNTPDN
ncbi:MAG: nucleoside hydrolase [Anaerolineae bacterium]|nr:nucleoside hydrolase [Anaerolineae bacterium]